MNLIVKSVKMTMGGYGAVKELYRSAFPKEERFPLLLLRLMTLEKDVRFSAYYDGTQFAGLSYTIESEQFYFVLYLAVNPKVRSKGYGSAILAHMRGQAGKKTVVLNVEPPEEEAENREQRLRRMEFYRRNGICDTGCGFSDGTIYYAVLSSDTEHFSPRDYEQFLQRFASGKESAHVEKRPNLS